MTPGDQKPSSFYPTLSESCLPAQVAPGKERWSTVFCVAITLFLQSCISHTLFDLADKTQVTNNKYSPLGSVSPPVMIRS